MSLFHAILRVAAILVRKRARGAWLAEWTAELWYVNGARRRFLFCLGSFRDASWVRRNEAATSELLLETPLRCLLILAASAAVTGFFAYRVRAHMLPQPLSAHLVLLGIAAALVPVFTPPMSGNSVEPRFRLYGFFTAKFILVVMIVFFFGLDISGIIARGALQPPGMLIGYILGLRWVWLDQRRRCPVCLRQLTHPARIGEASHTFLELYGTELVCTKGHGLLHVPDIHASYCAQRWLSLDRSWSGLFPSR